jgi:hypothetical protein
MQLVRSITADSATNWAFAAARRGSIEVGATEEVAAGAADELTSTLRKARGAGRAVDGVMLRCDWAGIGDCFRKARGGGLRRFRRHVG